MNGKDANGRGRRRSRREGRRGQEQGVPSGGRDAVSARTSQEQPFQGKNGGSRKAGDQARKRPDKSRFSGENAPGRAGRPDSGGRPGDSRVQVRRAAGFAGLHYDKNGELYDRPRWTAPKLNTDPLPAAVCARCGEAVEDLHAAFSDKRSGDIIHFDCVIKELSNREILEEGDIISYIGGGRFGVVHFDNPGTKGSQDFTIKRILEWEDKENRAEWRGVIADHYSIT